MPDGEAVVHSQGFNDVIEAIRDEDDDGIPDLWEYYIRQDSEHGCVAKLHDTNGDGQPDTMQIYVRRSAPMWTLEQPLPGVQTDDESACRKVTMTGNDASSEHVYTDCDFDGKVE